MTSSLVQQLRCGLWFDHQPWSGWADLLTIPVNLAGLPGISDSCSTAQGLPVGLWRLVRSIRKRPSTKLQRPFWSNDGLPMVNNPHFWGDNNVTFETVNGLEVHWIEYNQKFFTQPLAHFGNAQMPIPMYRLASQGCFLSWTRVLWTLGSCRWPWIWISTSTCTDQELFLPW